MSNIIYLDEAKRQRGWTSPIPLDTPLVTCGSCEAHVFYILGVGLNGAHICCVMCGHDTLLSIPLYRSPEEYV